MLLTTTTAATLACAFSWNLTTSAAQTASCESLARTALPNTIIAVAQPIVDGSFTPPGANTPIANLPPFCRVRGEIAPTSDSHILFEVWMPLENWNGKFAGVGNGGWAGTIGFAALAGQLRRGYAAAATNTGHTAVGGEDMAKFAFEHPEQLVDFAYRSHHETALKGKALVQTFYGRAPQHAYFIGCSSGGYEGLMAAQRFPNDYDGIVAGAPANNWTRLMAGDFDAVLATLKDPASVLSPASLQLLNRAAVAACDKADGIEDRLIADPRECRFDPASLTCTPDRPADSCLTLAQVKAAQRVYRGLQDPATGTPLYPGLEPGSEPAWPNRDPASPFPIPVSHYKWLVFADPAWSWKTFDFADAASYAAHQKAEAKLAPILNATDPNLRAFRQRGGKLLQYHGWNDNLIAPRNSINYYESVVQFFGGRDRAASLRDVQSFYRLYMAPGVGHCAGGPGPNTFDFQSALEAWVERGDAPESVVATHSTNGVVDRSRPLCPYPKVAVYTGAGSTDDAANFTCSEATAKRP